VEGSSLKAVSPPVRAGDPPHLRFGAGVWASARGANGRRATGARGPNGVPVIFPVRAAPAIRVPA